MELTEAETELANAFVTALTMFQEIPVLAAKVKAEGGDCQKAYLSVVPEDERAQAMTQWPMVSMMLGVG